MNGASMRQPPKEAHPAVTAPVRRIDLVAHRYRTIRDAIDDNDAPCMKIQALQHHILDQVPIAAARFKLRLEPGSSDPPPSNGMACIARLSV